ncbi:MAG: hypothetical protein EBY21_11170 [Alphaproteobacteria bacterium]|nr:hypothetical protein [Alphaproteobacteria bacterium]
MLSLFPLRSKWLPLSFSTLLVVGGILVSASSAQAQESAQRLRETILDKAQILEVIKCGRPGTAMPHFDKFAYTDKRCYNATADEIGNDKPPVPNTPLQIFEVEAVAEYIAFMVKDKGPPTKEMCQVYFKGNAAICEKYPAK